MEARDPGDMKGLKTMESSLKVKGAFKPVHVSTKLSQSLKTLGHKSLVV